MHRSIHQAQLRYYPPGQPSRERDAAERFVAERYARQYGAQLSDFYPHQLALLDDQGLHGCLGFRVAAEGALFLEQYLDAPIEIALGDRLGPPAVRGDVVEVGGLAADWPGAARRLIAMTIGWLGGEGYRIATFTATRGLVNSFRRLGLQPLQLGVADPARLQASHTDWGSYYANDPRVYAGLIRFTQAAGERARRTCEGALSC